MSYVAMEVDRRTSQTNLTSAALQLRVKRSIGRAEALLPLAKCGIIEHLGDLKTLLDESSPEAAKQVVERLIQRLSGSLDSPRIE